MLTPTFRLKSGFAAALVAGFTTLVLRAQASEVPPSAPRAAASAPARIGPADPLEALRLKLAERLGAVRAPESQSPNVLRVANKADPKATARGDSQGASPRSASAHTSGRAGAAAKPTDAADAHAPEASSASASTHAGHGASKEASPHWAYVGAEGPEAWSRLAPEAAACAIGQRQSPIDIRDAIAVNLAPIEFGYRPSAFTVRDNGHTIEVRWAEPQGLTVNGRRYALVQIHFHMPAEERVNGQGHAMVAHLVHRHDDGQLAVVAIFLDPGAAHPLVQAVWDALPLERGDSMPSAQAADLSQLLPADPRYFTYMGSLTTPPCTEGVLWLVMKQAVNLSPEQLAIFARFYPMNARPIQPASGRVIKEGL